jgi:hypothetical protein
MPSPTGGFIRDLHAAHHHHVAPRSTPGNHTQTTNAKAVAPAPQPMVIPKPKKIVAGNQAVLDTVANLPRNHLGDVPYEVKLKPARLQDPRTGRPPRYGYQSTPVPLPWDLIKDNLNCTLTVKVSKQHLVPAAREEITSRRALWGTDIYTDDSDVVAACIHGGWIRGEWPEEVDVDMLDLYATDDKDKKGKRSGPAKLAPQANNMVVLDAPPKGGPQNVPENQDLQVTVLILPPLEKYSSSCRFGIRSREFGSEVADASGLQHRAKHDGLSFMIMGLRWVNNGAGTQNRLRGKARRERIRRALREVELGPVWAAKSLNVDAGKAAEAAQQPAAPIDGDVEMTGNWWKHRGTPPSEGDKENFPATGVAAVVPAKQTVPEPVKEAVDERDTEPAQAEPDVSKGAAEEETSTAKEVDPDETMGDDTIVEDDQKEEDRTGGKEAEKKEEEPPRTGEPEEPEEHSQAEAVNGEKAAESTSAPAEQTGQATEGAGNKAESGKVSSVETAEKVVESGKESLTEPLKEAAHESAEGPTKETVTETATQAEPTMSA